MVYSEVLEAGLILSKKKKYTMRDAVKVVQESLFKPYKGQTLDMESAIFVVKCSAVFHNTDYSDSLNKALDKLRTYQID